MAVLNKIKSKKVDKAEEKKETAEIKNGGESRISQPKFLIKQAWLTERAGSLVADRKYIFIVNPKSTKPEVKKAVESNYNVKVEDVNIVNYKGKSKRLGRSVGRTSAFKKAIVTLKEGQKIEALMP